MPDNKIVTGLSSENLGKYKAALRDPANKQVFYTSGNSCNKTFCALALACHIGTIPSGRAMLHIITLNDDVQLSFPEIADRIE